MGQLHSGPLEETITLQRAKKLIQCMAQEQSFCCFRPRAVGKSASSNQAAREAGLPSDRCSGHRSRRGRERNSRIVGERSVFCRHACCFPSGEPFCCFWTNCGLRTRRAESFYSLLLERRWANTRCLLETWVVAAGNRMQDARWCAR